MSEPYPEPIVIRAHFATWELENTLNCLAPHNRFLVLSALPFREGCSLTVHPSPKEEKP